MISITDADLSGLSALSREEVDALNFGVVQVNDAGVVQVYNRYESELASLSPSVVEGKNFFTQVAPCTNNRLVYGRFREGVAAGELDVTLSYTLTYKMRPTNVRMRLYRDAATGRNWVLVQKR